MKKVRYGGWTACTDRETEAARNQLLLEAARTVLELARTDEGIGKILDAEMTERRDPDTRKKIVMYNLVCEVKE